MNPEKTPGIGALTSLEPAHPSSRLNTSSQQENGVNNAIKRKEEDDTVITEIRRQIGLAPENIEKPLEKGIILSPLSLKESLLDSLEPVFLKIGLVAHGDLWDQTQREITYKYTSIKNFSNEAGDFFKELIPQGIKGAEVSGQGRYNFTHNALIRKEVSEFAYPNFEGTFDKTPRKVLRENLENFFKKSIFRKERKPYEVKSQERKEGGVTIQEVSRAVNQQGGKNMIYERVDNDIYDSGNTRITKSNLVIQNIESGVALDLDALLPSNFHFEPGVEDLDLKVYGGTAISTGDFFESPSRMFVAYGDLTKKGNMLSLFHEIAHSWQENYSKDSFKGKFAYKKLTGQSYHLMYKLDNISRGIGVGVDENETKEKINELLDMLKNVGTDLVYKDGVPILSTATPVDEGGVINLQYILNHETDESLDAAGTTQELKESILNNKKYYPIINEKLNEAREAFIAEERDAWAHALRMMRFLKKRGLDIEPELKNLADVKEHIDPRLGSYQKGLERDIKLTEDDYRFSRLPQK